MLDPLSRTLAVVRAKMHAEIAIDGETELDALGQVDRICSLPFWLEEMTGTIPTDAELLNWKTFSDVAHWVAMVDRRAA